MANQHDFGLLTKSFGDIATQINLIANLPPVHDRLQSQTRHDQLVTGLQALENRNEEYSGAPYSRQYYGWNPTRVNDELCQRHE